MKAIQFVLTSTLNSLLTEYQKNIIIDKIHQVFQKERYDMFILEPDKVNPEITNIRIAGYHLITKELEENRIADTLKDIAISSKIWARIDDYEERYICTLLLPSEW